MDQKRYRILFIEKPAELGGSVISLYELVRGLDTTLYEPVVLFYGPNPYRERFGALGSKVITLSEQPPLTASTSSTRDIAAALSRYSEWLAAGYKSAKQLYLVIRQDLPLARRLAQLIKNEAVDLVHQNNTLYTNRATIMAARLAGVPQVCHVRMLQDLPFIEKYLARYVDKFIYISRAVETSYHNQGISAHKGQVIHDAIDIETFEQVNHSLELRAELGVTQQEWMITNVGRLDWWKGHDYFLQAVAELIKAQPNTKALIVGAPLTNQIGQTYYQKLQQLVTDLHLSKHVIFTGLRQDIPQVLAASDIVVHSASEPEPLGRVVIEGMAAGRPVIATAAGGVLDIIEDQVTGLLVPTKNAELMAKAMQQLLENPEQARIMGQHAQQEVKERFSIKRHAMAIQNVYQKILINRNSEGLRT